MKENSTVLYTQLHKVYIFLLQLEVYMNIRALEQSCSEPHTHTHKCAMLTVHGHPFVEVFSIWEHDSHAQVAAAQRCLGMLQQLILVGALRNVLLRLERLR